MGNYKQQWPFFLHKTMFGLNMKSPSFHSLLIYRFSTQYCQYYGKSKAVPVLNHAHHQDTWANEAQLFNLYTR
jgi:hypothetical protein